MSKKYLYYFSEGNDAFGGDKVTMKNTLGGKGAGRGCCGYSRGYAVCFSRKGTICVHTAVQLQRTEL